MSRRAAFTLVELLVVIGIIALLLSILIPVLGRAQESARQVKCLNNLKQISLATIQYCNDNKGYYPGRAGQGAERGERPDLNPGDFSGWIAWRRETDSITGVPATSVWRQNITHSALAKYFGVKVRAHATPADAHRVAASLETIYRCPSDNLERRFAFAADLNGGRGIYRYSYSMNVLFGNKAYDPANPTVLAGRAYRKISQVRRSSNVIIFMDESELSINNGEYNPLVTVARADDWRGDYSAISERHETSKSLKNSQNARGNVAFADGHGAFLSRTEAFKPMHFDPDGK